MNRHAAQAQDQESPKEAPGSASDDRIEPIAFRPTVAQRRRLSSFVRPVGLAVTAALLISVLLVWFILTARSVSLGFDPGADSVAMEDGWPTFELGGRILAQPGEYTLVAEKAGYRRFEQIITITEEPNQEYSFTLQKLPGYLAVLSQPEGASVSIDGQARGSTPLQELELEPGTYTVSVSADNFVTHEAEITVEGGAIRQDLEIELVPNRSPVSFASSPNGAIVIVDGEEIGNTPMTAAVAAGQRTIALKLGGYKTWQDEVAIVAGESLVLPEVSLEPADGTVTLRTSPAGANVTIDGQYRGRTPLNVALDPGTTHRINITRTGYRPSSRTLDIDAQQDLTINIVLEPVVGEVRIASTPADAQVYIDGDSRGVANQTLELAALPHTVEIRKEGYVPYRTTVTPRPGFAQEIAVVLKTLEQARIEAIPTAIKTSVGQELILIRPSVVFTMGASRREQGRRANESLRKVELSRPFYFALREVTNAEFRQFDPTHSSGMVQKFDVNADDQPAVRLTWEEAARFCNWLSEQESLPLAYETQGERVIPVTPMTTGYRMPTEAEWAYAARIAGYSNPPKYPWGEEMPPPQQAGNFADRSAARLVDGTINTFRDGHPATAPVASFKPNPIGVYDLGGNVAEWVHDLYATYPDAGDEVFRDPLGPDEGLFHVIRGSSWMDGTVSELRLTYRDYGDIDRPDLGFRIARYLE